MIESFLQRGFARQLVGQNGRKLRAASSITTRRRTEIQLKQLTRYGIPSETIIVLAMRLNFQSGLLDRMGNGLMGGQEKNNGGMHGWIL